MNVPMDFELLFQALPGNYLILLPDAPKFTIVAFNKKRAEETFTADEHIGKGVFEAFPDNPDDPEATGVANLTASLLSVVQHRQPHRMEVQKYDIRSADGVSFEERYWLPENLPVFGPDDRLIYIIHTVVDVTETMKATQRERAVRQNFQSLFLQSHAPFALFVGNDLVTGFINEAFRKLFSGRVSTGRPLLEMVPELRKQAFLNFLLKVLETGLPYLGMEVPVTAFFDNETLETTRYFNLNYTPYKNDAGITEGILATAYDVTITVNDRLEAYSSRAGF